MMPNINISSPIFAILFIGAIFLCIVLSSIVQLLLLRVAMIFPPVRTLVRWIMDTALSKD